MTTTRIIFTRKAQLSSSRAGSVMVRRIPVTSSMRSAAQMRGIELRTRPARAGGFARSRMSRALITNTAIRKVATLRMCTVCTNGTNHSFD